LPRKYYCYPIGLANDLSSFVQSDVSAILAPVSSKGDKASDERYLAPASNAWR
jgi:hypothetical protein